MTIKQTLDLKMKKFKITDDDDGQIWGLIFFDACRMNEDMIQLYDAVTTVNENGLEIITQKFLGAFGRENVKIIGGDEE